MSDWKQWNGPLEEPGAKWFVNRTKELEWLWKWASNVPDSFRSQSLVGLRRTGKTAILHKLFNRLYHEQKAVLPVYVSFGKYVKQSEPMDAYTFVKEYFEGYLRSYLAFKHRRPDFHANKVELEELELFAHEISDNFALELIEFVSLGKKHKYRTANGMMSKVITIPSARARQHVMPTVVIIDEFQVLTKVLDPDNNRHYDVTNFFQQASETQHAPLIVSGSSVSMMTGQALGGALSGRFRSFHLEPLDQKDASNMILRLGKHHNIAVTEEMALDIWHATRGYPYPIECIMNSPELNPSDPKWLDRVLIAELTKTTGALWDHYHEEYGKYISQMNGVTRKVVLWIIKHPKRRIFADAIAEELSLDEDAVRRSLDQLNEADVIRSTGWFSYEDPADPMLRRYLQYQHNREVEKLAPEVAIEDLVKEVNRIRGEASNQVGHLAEVIVGGVMERFDQRDVDGETYFGMPEPIHLPDIHELERREGVIKEGAYNEIDVVGEYYIPGDLDEEGERGERKTGAWLVSVRYRKQKMGVKAVEAFLGHVDAVQSEKKYAEVTRWYFSKAGFTEEGIQLLQAEGVYYSDLEQFNALANIFGFLGLHF